MIAMRYAIVIEQAGTNYSAYVPDLPGCVASGSSIADVETRIREAIAHARHKNPELEARLMVNQMQLNTLLAQEVLGMLPEFGIPMLAASLKSRTGIR